MPIFFCDHSAPSEQTLLDAAPEADWPQPCPAWGRDWIGHRQCGLSRSALL
ncbi:hypothetical protein [Pseudodesulfovibrio sp.]|uniref:hypothetical protein n=1 Tax=Pseudodesulfovibrio sp. TaxID=2035812 RepID=UPI002625B8AF|nr:hypothetical protein [Pseudodesulfovibrio sp.]MDD3313461.1 hypothetical protein [Pseudodesulfovibrio sp.]